MPVHLLGKVKAKVKVRLNNLWGGGSWDWASSLRLSRQKDTRNTCNINWASSLWLSCQKIQGIYQLGLVSPTFAPRNILIGPRPCDFQIQELKISLAQGTQTMLMLNPDTLSYSDWLTHNSSGFFGVNKSFIHLPLTHLFLFSMFRLDGSTHPLCLIFHNESKFMILILFPCTRYHDLRDNRCLRCYSGVTEVTGV